nr:glutathione S-transferase N-terminal domain-containing protein [Myxococcota bacterium]
MEIFGGTAIDALAEWTRARSLDEARRTARATLPTVVRLGAGTRVLRERGPRPAEMLILYERESCPHSRRVREALAMLDLDARIKPVPKGSMRHARELAALTNAIQIPVLVDPGMGVVVQESDAILGHLFHHYGRGRVPLRLRVTATSQLASRLRAEHGERARPSSAPSKTLELSGYEGSPATRIVREQLDELELPYISRSLAPHSPRRRAFFARAGTMELPHLLDASSGIEVAGVSAILAHLEATYGLS